MKILKLLPGIILATTLCITGCKPKDADIKASIEEKLKAKEQTASTMVMVNDGVASLSGELKSEDAKMESEKTASGVKGVKSVVNNITVMAAPPPPVAQAAPTIAADDTLSKSVRDATKDYPTVTATVEDGTIMLSGEVEKSSLRKLMMALSGLNAKKIDRNKLTVK